MRSVAVTIITVVIVSAFWWMTGLVFVMDRPHYTILVVISSVVTGVALWILTDNREERLAVVRFNLLRTDVSEMGKKFEQLLQSPIVNSKVSMSLIAEGATREILTGVSSIAGFLSASTEGYQTQSKALGDILTAIKVLSDVQLNRVNQFQDAILELNRSIDELKSRLAQLPSQLAVPTEQLEQRVNAATAQLSSQLTELSNKMASTTPMTDVTPLPSHAHLWKRLKQGENVFVTNQSSSN